MKTTILRTNCVVSAPQEVVGGYLITLDPAKSGALSGHPDIIDAYFRVLKATDAVKTTDSVTVLVYNGYLVNRDTFVRYQESDVYIEDDLVINKYVLSAPDNGTSYFRASMTTTAISIFCEDVMAPLIYTGSSRYNIRFDIGQILSYHDKTQPAFLYAERIGNSKYTDINDFKGYKFGVLHLRGASIGGSLDDFFKDNFLADVQSGYDIFLVNLSGIYGSLEQIAANCSEKTEYWGKTLHFQFNGSTAVEYQGSPADGYIDISFDENDGHPTITQIS